MFSFMKLFFLSPVSISLTNSVHHLALAGPTCRYWATADHTMLFCAFKDKKAKNPVLMVSTDSSVGNTLSTRKAVAKPIVVDHYNQHMSGCDRADQLVGYYGHQTRRSTKWWKKLVYWAMEIAMMNAYIIFKDTRPRPFQKSS